MDGYKLFVSPSDVATRRGCHIYINDELDTIEIENMKPTYQEGSKGLISPYNRPQNQISQIKR